MRSGRIACPSTRRLCREMKGRGARRCRRLRASGRAEPAAHVRELLRRVLRLSLWNIAPSRLPPHAAVTHRTRPPGWRPSASCWPGLPGSTPGWCRAGGPNTGRTWLRDGRFRSGAGRKEAVVARVRSLIWRSGCGSRDHRRFGAAVDHRPTRRGERWEECRAGSHTGRNPERRGVFGYADKVVDASTGVRGAAARIQRRAGRRCHPVRLRRGSR